MVFPKIKRSELQGHVYLLLKGDPTVMLWDGGGSVGRAAINEPEKILHAFKRVITLLAEVRMSRLYFPCDENKN